jgi:hypothetical protein
MRASVVLPFGMFLLPFFYRLDAACQPISCMINISLSRLLRIRADSAVVGFILIQPDRFAQGYLSKAGVFSISKGNHRGR